MPRKESVDLVGGLMFAPPLLYERKTPAAYFPPTYTNKIKALFGSSIIGYYRGAEASGTDALDESGFNYTGAYTGVTLGQPGIGDGLTCPLYDGANDFMQPPAGFRTALNGQLGSVLFWIAATDWTVTGDAFNFQVDASNFIRCQLNAGVTDRIELSYNAGGTTKAVAEASGQTTTAFRHFALTWSLAADQMIAYRAGIQLGSTQTALGTFVGAFSATQTLIGARITTPTNIFNGRIEQFCVLNRVAMPDEVAAAAVI